MSDASDLAALLRRCKEQDRAAFATLFERYHARVFRSAYLITHREDAADDITQLVFLELFSAFRTYNVSRPFLPWLYRIVHNVSMDYLKRDGRAGIAVPLEEADTLLGADPDPGPAERAEQAELRQAIWGAIAQLPAYQRVVLVLRYYVGLNEAEMAEAMQVRRGTVKSRLYRAQQALAGAISAAANVAAAPFANPGEATPQMSGDVP